MRNNLQRSKAKRLRYCNIVIKLQHIIKQSVLFLPDHVMQRISITISI